MNREETEKNPACHRVNGVYVVHVLKEHSDELNPMSAAQVQDEVNKLFAEKELREISLDTVKRILESLVKEVFVTDLDDDDDDEVYKVPVNVDWGFAVYRGKSIRKKRTYYYKSSFSGAEIATLIDSVETYNYFSDNGTAELVNKIRHIHPKNCMVGEHNKSEFKIQLDEIEADAKKPNKVEFDTDEQKKDKLLENIDLLYKAINNNEWVRITYCNYDEHKKLKVRNGYPKDVKPVGLVWSNGYYYMAAHNPSYDNKLANFRIDRITDIKASDRDEKIETKVFNASTYRMEHPVMYTGKMSSITMLCRVTKYNYLLNNIMDTFGNSFTIKKAEDELLTEQLGHDSAYYAAREETWYRVHLPIMAITGVVLWATQYGNDCRIIYPKIAAKMVKERLMEALTHYETLDINSIVDSEE